MRVYSCGAPCARQVSLRPRWMRPVLLVMAGMTLAIAGCSKGRHDRIAVYPAEGQVLWQGAPLAGAQVVLLSPQQSKDAKTIPSRGRTDTNGKFRLTTYEAGDGAPEGDYAVVVTCNPVVKTDDGWVVGPNTLPRKYANVKTTDLRVTLTKGPNTLPPLDLKQ